MSGPGTIRVWLEPGYDHGRTGAWMLDTPGAFTWGATRAGALARVPSAYHRFADWLEEHGEPRSESVALIAEVVEEVRTRPLEDGYQVMATFADEDREVAADELHRHLQRLRHAREDLHDLLGRLRAFEQGGGDVAAQDRDARAVPDGASDLRDAQGVLVHIGQTDAWFVSRLDPGARYEGPRHEDIDAFLQQSLELLLDRLEAVQRADSRAKRVDGKGETWTLAKLMRRTLYHALDHVDELSRRLDLATGAVDRLEFRKNAELDTAELRVLLGKAGLARRFSDSDELMARVLAGSTETVSAWDGKTLVGFARIISDEATNGYISTVAVAPRWQDRGLGTRLMRALMDGRQALKLTLDAREGAEGFYERLGFQRDPNSFIRPRPGGGTR